MSEFSDIIVVGAGPAGLSFCREFADSALKITVIEKLPLSVLQDPPFDAREIALTHLSKEIMEKLTLWQRIDKEDIYPLREAKVLDGLSSYQLHFPQPKKARGGATDRLGYLISNHRIRKAAYEAVKDVHNVNIITEHTVKDVQLGDDGVCVTLDDGRELNAQLLVCADSRFSETRHKVGIPTDMHNFGRTVLVFRTEHTKSNEHIAFECFHYGRTLAILPLTEQMSSMVITIDSNKADALLALSDEELAQDIYAETQGRLGEIKVIGTRHTYPLVGTHARRFYGKRCALIGDAAVGMHPVTAHGFNLGLEGAHILAKQVLQAAKCKKDIGAESVLRQYNFKHMLHTRPIYHGTNVVVKLFTTENTPARLLRSAVLRVSNNLPPVKKLISHQLTG